MSKKWMKWMTKTNMRINVDVLERFQASQHLKNIINLRIFMALDPDTNYHIEERCIIDVTIMQSECNKLTG